MALSTAAPLARLVAILQSITALSAVYTAVPESITGRVAAYVTVGSQQINDKASSQMIEREARYFIGLCYRVQGAEATAETTLAAVIDAITMALYNDRKLAGTVDSASIDFALADDPTYQTIAGQEFRIFPLLVVTKQRATFTLT